MLVVSFLFSNGRYVVLRRLQWLWWIAAVGVIGLLLLLGTRFRGAVFAAGGFTPTEVIKPLLVVFLAATTVLMLYAARGEARWLVLGGVGAIVLGVGMAVLATHGQQRLLAWLDPFSSPTGRGWQPLQSLSALYAGGLWGTGLGYGAPSTIPVASSDFIYAVIGEELGFLGCVLVVGLFLMIFREGLQRGEAEKDPFGRLTAIGLICMLAIQSLLNIGGVTKALPLTGVPLPFLSHGGSSLAVSFAMIGLVAAIGSRK